MLSVGSCSTEETPESAKNPIKDCAERTVETTSMMSWDDGVYRHWSPTSQTYASADILLQYLSVGWALDNCVVVEAFGCSGARSVKVYSFRLMHEEKDLWMPVIENPVVLRLIRERELTLRLAAPNAETNAVDSTGRGYSEPGSNSALNGQG